MLLLLKVLDDVVSGGTLLIMGRSNAAGLALLVIAGAVLFDGSSVLIVLDAGVATTVLGDALVFNGISGGRCGVVGRAWEMARFWLEGTTTRMAAKENW